MDFDTEVKLAIYRHIVQEAVVPTVYDIALLTGSSDSEIRDAYQRLYAKRVLVLEADGESIRMAPPFSGVETQHRVTVGDTEYYANCAWDALGVAAAFHQDADIHSRCEQSLEPLHLKVRDGSVEPEECIIHFAVPAAKWWDDIVFT